MGARWTEAEMQVLRDVGKLGVTLASQMHRLPGRTPLAAKSMASKNDIPLRVVSSWKDWEIAALCKIWRGKESFKVAIARELPGRSYGCARSEAQRLGLTAKSARGRKGRTGYSWLIRSIEAILLRSDPLTAKELAHKTGANVRSVSGLLKLHRGKTFRIAGWQRAGDKWAAQWALGKEADEPKPAPKTQQEIGRSYRARRRIRQSGPSNPFASLLEQVAA